MRHVHVSVLRRRLSAAVLLAVATAACSDRSDPLATHSDIDAARADWLAAGIVDYRFELRIDAQAGTSGYIAIRVEDDTVVSVDGEPWQRMTIAALWDEILAAREAGDLHNAVFDERGVPVEFIRGSLIDDSGARFLVRRFRPG